MIETFLKYRIIYKSGFSHFLCQSEKEQILFDKKNGLDCVVGYEGDIVNDIETVCGVKMTIVNDTENGVRCENDIVNLSRNIKNIVNNKEKNEQIICLF